jgi:hypothetical protein
MLEARIWSGAVSLAFTRVPPVTKVASPSTMMKTWLVFACTSTSPVPRRRARTLRPPLWVHSGNSHERNPSGWCNRSSFGQAKDPAQPKLSLLLSVKSGAWLILPSSSLLRILPEKTSRAKSSEGSDRNNISTSRFLFADQSCPKKQETFLCLLCSAFVYFRLP